MKKTRFSGVWVRLGILGLAGLLSACMSAPRNAPPLRTVAHVDLPRYMGDWRVIANIPYFAEEGCVDTIERYIARPDGKITNEFVFRKGSFAAPVQKIQALAWVHNKKTNAEWRVRFFHLITAKYFVLDLDKNYQWAVVGHPSRKYGWVLGRQRTLPDAQYEAILTRLEKQGYDRSKFVKVPQVAPKAP